MIAASCLMLSCASQLSAALTQKSQRKHSVWIRDYLCQREQYGVYQTLLPELSRSHEDKFTNYLRVNIHDFEDLCNLSEASISKRRTKFRQILFTMLYVF